MNKKDLLINIIITLIAVIIALFMIELILSVSDTGSDQFYVLDSKVMNLHKSNFTGKWVSDEFNVISHMNSAGFRDREHTIEKPPGVYRILILGDSMVEALQVPYEKSFPYLLEQKLNAMNSTAQFEVISMGVSGWGTSNEYLALNYYGLQYQPDMVILAFTTANDLRDNSYDFTKRANPSTLQRPFFEISPTGELVEKDTKWREYLFNQSFISQIQKNETSKTPQVNLLSSLRDLLRPFFPKTSVFVAQKISYLSQSLDQQPDNNSPSTKPLNVDTLIYVNDYSLHDDSREYVNAWNVTKRLILETRSLSEKNNATFELVSLTSSDQFRDLTWWNNNYDKQYPEYAPFDPEKPEKILMRFSDENNISYLPLIYKFLASRNSTVQYHFQKDMHWAENGHQLAADSIYEKIFLNKNFTAPS
jgi:hypothetical protein